LFKNFWKNWSKIFEKKNDQKFFKKLIKKIWKKMINDFWERLLKKFVRCRNSTNIDQHRNFDEHNVTILNCGHKL